MTDEQRDRAERLPAQADLDELADPADQTQPAEGGRAEVQDLPGADTAEAVDEERDQAVH